MADEDEDLSHIRGPKAAEVDLSDEMQDFRFLNSVTGLDTGNLTIPKRGEKDFEPHMTSLQLDTLEASRQAMNNFLSLARVHTEKNRILAMYHPESNMACVDKVKTQLFQTMGRARGGKEWLLPEEALFLLERGSLDCRWPVKCGDGEQEARNIEDGAPMSLQGAYAAFVGFEGGVGGKLTLEMYNVYAGLKRSGYVVFRAGAWDEEREELRPPPANGQLAGEKETQGYWSRFFAEVWRRISTPTYSVPAQNLSYGPLVRPGLYRSYADIYRLLQLIPAHDRTKPPSFNLPADATNPFRIHFEVYKTSSSGKFRKSQRGPPDFRIAVINARDTPVPTAAQVNDLLATVPYDPPNDSDQMFKKLKHGSRNVILAVVDNGVPSYIRVADAPFGDVRLYERTARAPRGKGGRGRGGRGRGGRGRGR